jgi:hypothetical protein
MEQPSDIPSDDGKYRNQCECGIVHWDHKLGECPSEATLVYNGKVRKWKLCESCSHAYDEMFHAKRSSSAFLLKDPTRR